MFSSKELLLKCSSPAADVLSSFAGELICYYATIVPNSVIRGFILRFSTRNAYRKQIQNLGFRSVIPAST
jgi:hypothetical protein